MNLITVFMNQKTFEENKQFFEQYDVRIREYLDDGIVLTLSNNRLETFHGLDN